VVKAALQGPTVERDDQHPILRLCEHGGKTPVPGRRLERLHANKDALLVVLDRPEVPLNTNGSERDLHPQAFRGASAAVGLGSGFIDPREG
jgi:hypothetical protein